MDVAVDQAGQNVVAADVQDVLGGRQVLVAGDGHDLAPSRGHPDPRQLFTQSYENPVLHDQVSHGDSSILYSSFFIGVTTPSRSSSAIVSAE